MNINNIVGQLPRNGTQDSAHSIGSITHIIVHHDAEWRPDAYDDLTRYRNQANYHISKGEDGLQYHYKISNMGDVYQCRNLTDTLWHCSNYAVNRASIAICLDGNMQEQLPTAQQLAALQALLDELCTQHPEFPADSNDVFGHQEVALPGQGTACPGVNLIGYVRTYRNGGAIVNVTPQPPVNPPVVQDPPKPQYFKVYNFAGEQIGAYSTQENAQKKLDTVEAGSIKNPSGVTIVTKVKQAPVTEPPFVGDVIVTPAPPVTPETPPVVETSPTPEETPTEEVKPATSHNILDVLKAIWDLIITPIIATIKFFKKGGK